MAKKNQIEDRKPIIRDAMLYYYLEFESDILTKEDITKLLDYADLEQVPDRVILLNDIYQENLDWNQLSNQKIARLISMFIDRGDVEFILERVSFSEKRFKIRDVYWCLVRQPELTEIFGIDLQKLTRKDAYQLLKMGHQYFAERINIPRYNFNTTEIYKIAKAYFFDREILEKIKVHLLEGFHVSEAMINTGRDNIDLLNLSKMNASHWVRTLEKRKTLFDLCNFEVFLEDDVYHSIKLLELFPKVTVLHDYVKKNADTVGDAGWKILLENFPDEYIDLCDYNTIYEGTWNKILAVQPQLEAYRKRAVKLKGLT